MLTKILSIIISALAKIMTGWVSEAKKNELESEVEALKHQRKAEQTTKEVEERIEQAGNSEEGPVTIDEKLDILRGDNEA